jgi:hypothetical protein
VDTHSGTQGNSERGRKTTTRRSHSNAQTAVGPLYEKRTSLQQEKKRADGYRLLIGADTA